MTDKIFYEELRAAIRDAVASYLDLYTDEELRELATESLKPSSLPDGWRLADHPVYGRVIVTNTTPTRDGRVYGVLPAADHKGFSWFSCYPDALTYLDGDS